LSVPLPIFQLPWAEVKKEMTAEKGLDPETADKIGEYVKHKGMQRSYPPHRRPESSLSPGGPELLTKLLADSSLTANQSAKQGLAEMSILFTLLRAYKVMDKVISSRSFPLARHT
jgi:histidyl-tRNA synthetase